MLTSKIKRRLDIPGEEGQWIEIRALGGRALQEAEDIRTRRAAEVSKAFGSELLKALEDYRPEVAAAEAKADPLTTYDPDKCLRSGVVAWSYPERVTPENLEDLDKDTREWAAREILALTIESEADRKNA